MASLIEKQTRAEPKPVSERESGTGDKPVGYRNPPKSKQFVKGQSGNPGGRPRNLPSLDFDNLLIGVLESRHGERSYLEIMIDTQLKQAFKGDTTSYKTLKDDYVAAKQRQRHGKNTQAADQQAAEWLLGSIGDYIKQDAGADSASLATSEVDVADE